MARVLIAGCGYVGTELGLRLVDRGHAVWAVRQRASLLPPELHPHSADLTDPDAVAKLPFPFDFVVFAAAPAAGTEEAYEQAYIHALSRVLEAASNRRPPKRVLLTSSTSVYAQSDGGWVDESSPTRPSSFRGTIVLQAEEILRHSGSSFSILRLGGIYGPERTSLLDRVLAGEAVLTPGSSRYTNRIHRDDAASALLHLLELDPCAEVYVGVDEEPAELDEVLQWVAARTGSHLLEGNYPGPESPPNQASRGLNKRCSSALLRASGFQFLYPSYRQGYSDLLAELGDLTLESP